MRIGPLSVLLLILLTPALPQRAAADEKEPLYEGKTIKEWTAALMSPTLVDRANAALALGRIGAPAKAAAPALIEALRDKANFVAGSAAGALSTIGPDPKASLPPLQDILKDKTLSAQSRGYAADVLGDIGPDAKAALPALTAASKEDSVSLRCDAAYALYKIDPENAKTAVSALMDGLKEKDEQVRTGAVERLGDMGAKAKDAVPAMIAALKAQGSGMTAYYARSALGKMGPDAVPALVDALNDKDEDIRAGVASVLKEYYPDAAKKAGVK